jgi:hypothetical protein
MQVKKPNNFMEWKRTWELYNIGISADGTWRRSLHGGTHNQNEAYNAPIPVFLLLNWLPILQLVTSMMDPEQFYLFWKILVLTLESILPKPVRRLILTGFGAHAKTALTHPKSAAEKLDSRKRGIMKPRKQKRNPSMRLVLSNWEHELWFKFNI